IKHVDLRRTTGHEEIDGTLSLGSKVRELELIRRGDARSRSCISRMGVAIQATIAHKTGKRCPAQHLAGTAEKTATRLKSCPFLLEILGNGHVHDIGASFAIGAKRMLLHRLSCITSLPSRPG